MDLGVSTILYLMYLDNIYTPIIHSAIAGNEMSIDKICDVYPTLAEAVRMIEDVVNKIIATEPLKVSTEQILYAIASIQFMHHIYTPMKDIYERRSKTNGN